MMGSACIANLYSGELQIPQRPDQRTDRLFEGAFSGVPPAPNDDSRSFADAPALVQTLRRTDGARRRIQLRHRRTEIQIRRNGMGAQLSTAKRGGSELGVSRVSSSSAPAGAPRRKRCRPTEEKASPTRQKSLRRANRGGRSGNAGRRWYGHPSRPDPAKTGICAERRDVNRRIIPFARLLSLLALLFLAPLLSRAARPAEADLEAGPAYGAVVLRARVIDRRGQAVPGLRVLFHAAGTGVARASDGGTKSFGFTVARAALTDQDGLATVEIKGTAFGFHNERWFRGSGSKKTSSWTINTLRSHSLARRRRAHAARFLQKQSSLPTLALTPFEQPDTHLGRFPVWLSDDKKLTRIVVLIEGFDLYNIYSATDNMVLVGAAGDALRAAGVSFLVVDFRRLAICRRTRSLPSSPMRSSARRRLRGIKSRSRP